MHSRRKHGWMSLAVLPLICGMTWALNVPPSTQPPGGLATSATPQIVLLTFDDSVTSASYARVMQALEGFTNPNGYPIKATFFVSLDSNYDPLSIRRLYERGHEIAVHTMSHTTDENSSWIRWTQEIAGCRRTLAALCGLPEAEIVGFRAPFLKPNDHTFRVLHERGFLYDSSFAEGLGNFSLAPIGMLWPYTLNTGLAQAAPAERRPLTGYPGLFEVPLWVQFTNNVTATPMDPPETLSSNAVVALWQENFLAHYQGNRAPYGVFLHATSSGQWLGDPTQAAWRIGALREFIGWVQSYPDTWFVTCGDLVQFMASPVDAAHVATNTPFLTLTRAPFPEEEVNQCSFPNSHVLRVCGPCPPAAPNYANAYLGKIPMPGGAAWINIVSQDTEYAWCTLTVSNDVSDVIYDWQVSFTVAGGIVQQLYDAVVSQADDRVTAAAKSYNSQMGSGQAQKMVFRLKRNGDAVGFDAIAVAVEGLGPQKIQMAITRETSGNGWHLSWSDNAHLYQLQATTNLLLPEAWLPVTNGLTRPEFRVPPGEGTSFFRILGTTY